MYELSEVDQSFIQELHYSFDDIHIGNRFTLLEEDFADTSYLRRYPHQQPYDSDNLGYFSKSNLLNEIKNSDLLVGEKNDLILAVNEEQRVINHYRTWGVVPFEYLNKYAHGFYLITPEAYVFYTPALILNLVLNPEFFKGVAFDKWLSRLLMEVNEYNSLTLFNNNQSRLIKKFLSNLLIDKSIIDFIEVRDVKRALENIREK